MYIVPILWPDGQPYWPIRECSADIGEASQITHFRDCPHERSAALVPTRILDGSQAQG
jgi:hypothetical protein